MENLVENIVDKFGLTFKRLFYLQGTEVYVKIMAVTANNPIKKNS